MVSYSPFCSRFRVITAICLLPLSGLTQGRAQDLGPPPQKSRVIRWEDTHVNQAGWGSMHRYLTGETFATERAYVAAAVIQPGKAVHAEHRHAEEEYLAIIEGEGTWALDGKQFPAKRGDLLYVEPWVYHGLTNTGSQPLVFLVIKYNGKGTPPPPRPDDRPDELKQPSGPLPEKAAVRSNQPTDFGGVITLNGAPLSNAGVCFESPDGARLYSTRTDDQGRYAIPKGPDGKALEPGGYRVRILQESDDEAESGHAAGNTIPQKYADPSKAELRILAAPGKNNFNFELSD